MRGLEFTLSSVVVFALPSVAFAAGGLPVDFDEFALSFATNLESPPAASFLDVLGMLSGCEVWVWDMSS